MVAPEIDTICAPATATGGALAVVRIAGHDAIKAVMAIWQGADLQSVASHTVHLGNIIDRDRAIDQAVATVYRAPQSYTGDDIVELSLHGSPWIVAETMRMLTATGLVRMAEPGEFTRRAFLAGKLDLTQAEAVADLIAARSRAAAVTAVRQLRGGVSRSIAAMRDRLVELAALLELELDFSDHEDIEFASRPELRALAFELREKAAALLATYRAGNAMREGIRVVIMGEPNAGKSTLLNALAADDLAIVSDEPGTTRDLLHAAITLGSHRLQLTDTAGLRPLDQAGAIEAQGIDRARRAAEEAAIILRLTPAPVQRKGRLLPPLNDESGRSRPIQWAAPADAIVIDVTTKADLADAGGLAVSALTGQGMDALKETIIKACDEITAVPSAESEAVVTNARHSEALAAGFAALDDTLAALDASLPPDLAAHHLRRAISAFDTLTGAISSDTLLSTIFSRFCIGK